MLAIPDVIGFYEFFSVVVKADKKLLTVLFPDGRDGRAFTLKVLFWCFPVL